MTTQTVDILSIITSLRKVSPTYTLDLARRVQRLIGEHPRFSQDPAEKKTLRKKLDTALRPIIDDQRRRATACSTIIEDHLQAISPIPSRQSPPPALSTDESSTAHAPRHRRTITIRKTNNTPRARPAS